MLTVRDLVTRAARVDRLDLAAGEAVALMGPSGSGKSLVLRAIADLDPNGATVTLDGVDRSMLPAPEWRRRVGYLAAESGWWAQTVAPHFRNREAARPLLARLGFEADVLAWSIDRLSTGEKQRLALARLLTGGPRVLLLDEPTGALDPDSAGRVEAIIGECLADGRALLLVTHDRDQARRIAGRRFEIADGRLVPARSMH